MKINTFSRLFMQQNDLIKLINVKKEQMSQLQDGIDEMELNEDDEKIPYKLGDSFFHIPVVKARQLIEKQQAELKQQIAEQAKQSEEINKQMKNLKAKLYAKFGNQINLEDD